MSGKGHGPDARLVDPSISTIYRGLWACFRCAKIPGRSRDVSFHAPYIPAAGTGTVNVIGFAVPNERR